MNRPSAVSIVVATRNRCRQVLSTLERLVTLPERPPVIVVDNASGDPTVAAVASSFPDVRLIPLERNHGAAARNFGVDAAATPYVAFSDDDSWWAEGALDLAEDALQQSPKLGLIAARILVGPEQRLDPTCARMAVGPANEILPGRAVSGFVACGAVVRRDAYLDAGGFHPRYGTGGEERLLALDLLRRGWGLVFIADIVCHHHPGQGGDRTGREVTIARNDLWTAWLRHRPRRALAETWGVCKSALRDRAHRQALVRAVRDARLVLAERDPLSAEVERYILGLAGP